MPKENKNTKDFTDQNKKTHHSEMNSRDNKRGYQEQFEKAKEHTTLTEKITVYAKSFRLKTFIVMSVLLYAPVLMTFIILLDDIIYDFLLYHPDFIQNLPTTIFEYTLIIASAWIPDLLFGLMGYNYTNQVLNIAEGMGIEITSTTAPIFYMWFNMIVIWITIWIIVLLATMNFRVKPKMWSTIVMSPRTIGEKWEFIFSKSQQKLHQSLRDDRSIEKGAKLLTNLKFFQTEVDRGVAKGIFKNYKYKFDFTQYLPVYQLFFNRQDSMRANMLAGKLNKRWETLKYKKQELQTEEKFFSLIDSGYKFGKTPRDDVKHEIVNSIPYFFISQTGLKFNEKSQIFDPDNRKFLKRNIFILLAVTIILKNQILPPILRFVKKKYNIEFNRNELIFLSNSRRIFKEYKLNDLEIFDKFDNYDLPISLQYDYPFVSIGNKTLTLSKEVSESINDFGKTQQEVFGYVNEINSLLPKLEEFDLPQPAFNTIFIKNLNNILLSIQRYIMSRISIDPVLVTAAMDLKDDEYILEMIKLSINECIISPLVERMPLLKDPDLQLIYENATLKPTISKKIKINEATNNLILQQMNLTSYSVFRNELNNLSLGQVNYTIDHLYKKIHLRSNIRTTLDLIFSKYQVELTFKSIDTFFKEKEKQLIKLL